MSKMTVVCSGCGQVLMVAPDSEGKTAKCPKCGVVVQIPATAAEIVQGPAHGSHAETKPCPYCGEEIKAVAIVCRHCAMNLETGVSTQAAAPPGTPQLVPVRGQTAEFKRRAPAAIYPLVFITLGVYFLIWIYKIHKELYCRLGPARATSPGLALGLMFIPGFNFAWMIITLHRVARLSNQMLEEIGRPYEKASAGGILAMLIIGQLFNLTSFATPYALLVMIPLLWVATAKVQSVLNRAWAAQGLISV